MSGEIRRLAAFLDIPIDETKWNEILEHCSFAYMKSHASKSVPLAGAFWDGGAKTFINKGENDRWRDVLTKDESLKYENMSREKLSRACALWLATGELSN